METVSTPRAAREGAGDTSHGEAHATGWERDKLTTSSGPAKKKGRKRASVGISETPKVRTNVMGCHPSAPVAA